LPTQPILEQRLGIVTSQGSALVFLTLNQHLATGTPVFLVGPGERISFEVSEGPLPGEAPEAFPLVLIGERHSSAYHLRGALGAESLELPELGVAALPGPAVDPAQPDLDGDGAAETVTECTSLEGVHVVVSPGEGKSSWHAYYYLGYDVEPTCPE
jgi:hypothetical protein